MFRPEWRRRLPIATRVPPSDHALTGHASDTHYLYLRSHLSYVGKPLISRLMTPYFQFEHYLTDWTSDAEAAMDGSTVTRWDGGGRGG